MQQYLDLISTAFTEPVHSAEAHRGDDFTVIEINGEWMFRFPISADAPAVLEIEKQFLSEFASISPIPVPEYRIQGPGFVGYRKINGLLLSTGRFKALPAESQARIVQQIGSFLNVLHSFPCDRARQMGMSEGWNGWRRKAFQTFRADIASRLSQKALRSSMACFEAFFSQTFTPVVIHGDFYPRDHLFLDPKHLEISGVIDFGDLTLEDPACDLKNILSDFGEDILNEVLEVYDGAVDNNLIERMRLMIRAEPLFDAAYAVQFGYPGRLTQQIRDIEAAFGKFPEG
jgi:aminoglycoside 2''-phosphotransferase